MKKRLFAGFIAAVTASVCISIPSFAQTDDSWTYEFLNNEITITGYRGSDMNITIPSEILGTPVTRVEGEGIFKKQTSVTYPSTVKEITNVFAGATGLRTVILPEGIEKIDADAFNGCKQLKNIKLPSTINSIGDRAFANCIALEDITIPSGLVNGWDESAFANSGLKEADLSGFTQLQSGAMSFKDCKSLEKVELYPGISSMPAGMFSGCSALKEVEFPSSSRVSTIPKNAFYNCLKLESINLPVSVTVIENDAFTNCDMLKEVIIPYGTQKIGWSFQSCNVLESVYIPDTVTYIDVNFLKESTNAKVYCSDTAPAVEFCKQNGISHFTDSSVNSGITVIYNGKRVSFQNYEQNPEIIDDSTMVPLRSIFEAMNAGVVWNDASKTVYATRGTVSISIAIGENVMYKNSQEIKLEVPAQIVNERTMVPVRVIAEAFGAEVEWDGAARTVIITE
ncbi:MAG: leucine-rich repeat protein [Candidatus Ornithomonoglobus sp.]